MITQVTRSAPERVDREQRHQRGVDAAGEAEHHPLEAVLVDVVAEAGAQRGVDLRLGSSSSATGPPTSVASPGHLERGQPRRRASPAPLALSRGPPAGVPQPRRGHRRGVDRAQGERLLELGCARHHAALLVDGHAVAVEDQLVLAADGVAEQDRRLVVVLMRHGKWPN